MLLAGLRRISEIMYLSFSDLKVALSSDRKTGWQRIPEKQDFYSYLPCKVILFDLNPLPFTPPPLTPHPSPPPLTPHPSPPHPSRPE